MKRKLLILTSIFILAFSATAFADGEINHGTYTGCEGEIGHGTRQCEEPVNFDGETGHGNLWDYVLTIFAK